MAVALTDIMEVYESCVKEAKTNNLDALRLTASKCFDIPYSQVTPQNRDSIKSCLFPYFYASSASPITPKVE